METRTRNEAEDYCRTIGEELIALETVLGGAPRGYDPDDTDDEESAEFREAVDTLEMRYVSDTDDIPHEWLNATCLDLSVRKDTRGDDYPATVEILRTCGGPRCDIVRDTFDGTAVTITTHSGGESYTLRTYLPNVAAWLDNIAESY